MKSLDPKALEAASRAFRRMHNSVCYPSASENEADWAASEIVSAYLAALDATSNPPLSDLSSLRKGAEVVGEAAAYDFVAGWHERQAKLFREMAEDDPRTAKPARDRAKEAAIHHAASAAALRNRASDDRRAALVSGNLEDGADG